VIPARHVARIGSIEMAGTGEPTQHPSPHLLLHCGEILWPQRGRLGELDLPVGAGNEHPVDYPAVEVDMRIQRAAEVLHETHRPHSPARTAASEFVLYLRTRNTVSLLECRTCPECSALVVRVPF
jgi:hypothetical protein